MKLTPTKRRKIYLQIAKGIDKRKGRWSIGCFADVKNGIYEGGVCNCLASVVGFVQDHCSVPELRGAFPEFYEFEPEQSFGLWLEGHEDNIRVLILLFAAELTKDATV